MRDPRVDPDLARRRVEHAVGAAARPREVLQQLDRTAAAGAGAHLAPAGGDERAREPVGEEPSWKAALRRSAPVKSHQLCRVPLPDAALVAASKQGDQPLDEDRVLVRGHADLGGGLAQEAGKHREVLGGLREWAGAMISFGPPACANRIRVAPTRWSRTVGSPARDPRHRVGQVAVEAREEAEAVLAGEIGAAVRAGAGTGMLRALPPGARASRRP